MESKQPQDTESRHADKYIVRFPAGMRDQLKATAKANGRTLNAEIVSRLQQSFEPRSDADWELRVARHVNEARGDLLVNHISLLNRVIEQLQEKISKASGPAAVRDIQDELRRAMSDLDQLEERRISLMHEGIRLGKASNAADQEVEMLLDRLADGAMQDDLRNLHALEERLGISKDRRFALPLPPEEKKNVLTPQPEGIAAYKAVLEEALAARDQQIRQWWMQEFGYDPATRKPDAAQEKAPERKQSATKKAKE